MLLFCRIEQVSKLNMNKFSIDCRNQLWWFGHFERRESEHPISMLLNEQILKHNFWFLKYSVTNSFPSPKGDLFEYFWSCGTDDCERFLALRLFLGNHFFWSPSFPFTFMIVFSWKKVHCFFSGTVRLLSGEKNFRKNNFK